MNWSEVTKPFWEDRPTIIVGAGRSLKGFDLSQLRGLGYIIAVNGALDDLPFADVSLTIDRVWPRKPSTIDLFKRFSGEIVLCAPVDQPEMLGEYPGATYLKRRRRCDGLSDDPGEIEAAGTSGHGALNYAYLKKSKMIFLFGFDYDGNGHYCQERYDHEIDPKQNNLYWPQWGLNFSHDLPQLKAAGVTVINASPNSNVEAFPKCSPLQALGLLVRESWKWDVGLPTKLKGHSR